MEKSLFEKILAAPSEEERNQILSVGMGDLSTQISEWINKHNLEDMVFIAATLKLVSENMLTHLSESEKVIFDDVISMTTCVSALKKVEED